MKLWVDDVRPAPSGYHWARSVWEAKVYICQMALPDDKFNVEILDLDHDAGDQAWNGGDFIEILKWMERKGINSIPIRLHTMNVVGRENMRAIIRANGWKEVQ